VVAAEPIAAAALTLHGDVAVVGGASTLPERRGEGGQSALLRHRISVATQAGCDLLVATAQPNSVSAANLRRAGFRTVRRTAWTSGAM
jgi:GNAT superfamily N-acetyltransferase